ncbi:MAG: DUF2341 domain-containing protein [Candidatus Aenigmatarchaeota archaeon]
MKLKLIFLFFLFFLIFSPSAFAWFDQNWQYRREISISNSGNFLTDYQILTNINTQQLIQDGKMLNNCEDIRFVSDDYLLKSSASYEGVVPSGSNDVWINQAIVDDVDADGSNELVVVGTDDTPISSQAITIGTGTSSQRAPIDIYYNYHCNGAIYLKSEIGRAGKITKIRWYISSANPDTVNGVTIYMSHTSLSSWSSAPTCYRLQTGTLVFSGNLNPGSSTGWYEITLQTPFEYNNVDNLIISLRHQDGSYETSYSTYRYTPSTNRFARGSSDVSNPPIVALSSNRPNIQLVFESTPKGFIRIYNQELNLEKHHDFDYLGTAGVYAEDIAIDNIDADAYKEIVVIGWSRETNSKGMIKVFQWDGSSITEQSYLWISEASPVSLYDVKVWDYDNDGEREIIVGGRLGGSAVVYIYNTNLVQEKRFVYDISPVEDLIRSINSINGKIAFSGFTIENAGKLFIRIIDSNGNILKSKEIQDATNYWMPLHIGASSDINMDGSDELVITASGDYGTGTRDAKVFAFDSSLNLLWEKMLLISPSYELAGEPNIIDLDNDGEREIIVRATKSYSWGNEAYLFILNGYGYLKHSESYTYNNTDAFLLYGKSINDLDKNGLIEIPTAYHTTFTQPTKYFAHVALFEFAKDYTIPYWIESGCNSQNTKIWVKVPFIPELGSAKIYMYYGNPSASSKSNKTLTFDSFSTDFSKDPTIDGRWEVIRTTGDSTNECYWDSGIKALYLTKAVNNKGCMMFFTTKGYPVEIFFNFLAGGGNGADGLHFGFDVDRTNCIPSGGGSLGACADGWMVEIDNYDNGANDPSGNYIAVARSNNPSGGWPRPGNNYYNTFATEDNLWHTITIQIAGDLNSVNTVLLDSNPILNGISISKLGFGYFGFGGGTGGLNNNHIIDEVKFLYRKFAYPDPSVVIGEEQPQQPTEWIYRKAIKIYSSYLLTDYQVLITNPIYNESDLVGSWHFSEGFGSVTKDYSDYSNDGTIYGATWVDGKFGKALSFDGNDYVALPNNTARVRNRFSITAWIKLNKLNQRGHIIDNAGDGNDGHYYIYIENLTGASLCPPNHIVAGFRGSAWRDFCTNISNLKTNEWYFITATYDGSTFKFYINAVIKNQTSLADNVNYPSNSLVKIGANAHNSWWFDGLIDEVRVYNRTLSDSEVLALYQAKARLDYGDIRFRDSDMNTELNYWQEADGKFWVKVPSIPSGTKTIYVYYGNPYASLKSSALTTFIPNQIFLITGRCNDANYCGYTDNHEEFDYIRQRIGSQFAVDNFGYVTSINHGTNPYGASDNYFSRYRFLFIPSVSGTYYFGTNSDDASEAALFPSDGYGGGFNTSHPFGLHSIISSWYGGHGTGSCGLSGTVLSKNLREGRGYWIEYMQTEWGGGQYSQFCINIPGVGWNVLDTSNVNFNYKIFSRKYVSPEPEISIGKETFAGINLIVDLLYPEEGILTEKVVGGMTELRASVYCEGSSGDCGNVEAFARYNSTGNAANTNIPSSGTPLYANPVPFSCGILNVGSVCNANFNVFLQSEGNYAIDVNFISDSVNSNETEDTYLRVILSLIQRISLRAGWNLISIPYQRVVTVISDPCNISSKNFYFFNSTQGRWEAFKLKELVGGKGYWVYSSKDCDVDAVYYGSVSIGDFPNIKKGYNLIGTTSQAPYDINSVKGDCNIEKVIYWDGINWVSTTTITPWKGYWIFVSRDCRLY